MVNYVLKPSLERIALVKISSMLWCQDDIKDLVANFSFPKVYVEYMKNWRKIEDMVIKKLSTLPQPGIFKDKISDFIQPVGLEISKWMEYHQKGCDLKLDLPNDLCWTSQGTINKRKTAEKLIQDETMDIATRYKLSCIYCLEDDILKFWNEMPEDCRKSFYSEEDPVHVEQKELVVFWTYNIKGEMAKLNNVIEKTLSCKGSPYRYAFEISARNANKDATEYFLEKLTPVERQENLFMTACSVAFKHDWYDNKFTCILREYYSEILCTLLNQMEEQQQIEIFKSHYFEVLKCLFDWPWQIFFMETASHTWSLFSEMYYGFCLMFLSQLVAANGNRGFNFRHLFKEFWQQSPDVLKKLIINKHYGRSVLLFLFKAGDEDNIKMIFQYVSDEERKWMIFHDNAQDIFIELMKRNKWNLVKFFIKECLTSKDDLLEFKEQFEDDELWHFEYSERRKRRWDRFQRLLNESVREFDKRKCVKSDNKTKKWKL